MKLFWCTVLALCLNRLVVDSRIIEIRHNGKRRMARQKYTVRQLLNVEFPRAISNDLDLDVCKAGEFAAPLSTPGRYLFAPRGKTRKMNVWVNDWKTE